MTEQEKQNYLSKELNLDSYTAKLAVDMLASQRAFLIAIAMREHDRCITDVTEIIDKYVTYIFGNGLSEEKRIALWNDMRDRILALKGGEQE